MWLRWFPWRVLVNRAAQARGLIDPVKVLARLENFAQPLEGKVPLERIRAGREDFLIPGGEAKPFWYHRGMLRKPKINCWEFHGCERQPGGKLAWELGVCPASTDSKVDGINGGTNGGRCCWTIAGTMCGGDISGTMAEKFGNCLDCEFFWRVADEEEDFIPSLSFVDHSAKS